LLISNVFNINFTLTFLYKIYLFFGKSRKNNYIEFSIFDKLMLTIVEKSHMTPTTIDLYFKENHVFTHIDFNIFLQRLTPYEQTWLEICLHKYNKTPVTEEIRQLLDLQLSSFECYFLFKIFQGHHSLKINYKDYPIFESAVICFGEKAFDELYISYALKDKNLLTTPSEFPSFLKINLIDLKSYAIFDLIPIKTDFIMNNLVCKIKDKVILQNQHLDLKVDKYEFVKGLEGVNKNDIKGYEKLDKNHRDLLKLKISYSDSDLSVFKKNKREKKKKRILGKRRKSDTELDSKGYIKKSLIKSSKLHQGNILKPEIREEGDKKMNQDTQLVDLSVLDGDFFSNMGIFSNLINEGADDFSTSEENTDHDSSDSGGFPKREKKEKNLKREETKEDIKNIQIIQDTVDIDNFGSSMLEKDRVKIKKDPKEKKENNI